MFCLVLNSGFCLVFWRDLRGIRFDVLTVLNCWLGFVWVLSICNLVLNMFNYLVEILVLVCKICDLRVCI